MVSPVIVCSVALSSLALGLSGCEPGLSDPRDEPALDPAYFRCKVQPIMASRCGALVCHGSQERFFRVFARNRFRPLLGGAENRDRNTALSEKEIQFNYDSALGYVDASSPDDSYLLRKPLDQKSAGFYHGGATEFGQGDVFLDKTDPDYETIHAWITGATDDPACVEPGAM